MAKELMDDRYRAVQCPNCQGRQQVCRRCGWVRPVLPDGIKCNAGSAATEGGHEWIDCPECDGVGEV